MAAQTRLFQTTNDLATLRELLELAKNPKDIIAAHELARKEMALTDAEAKKVAEAKDYIAQYNRLSTDIKTESDNLAKAKAEHQADMESFHAYASAEVNRLQDLDKDLGVKAVLQIEVDKYHAEEAKKLDAAQQDVSKQLADGNRKLAIREAQIEKDKATNTAEANRLAEVRKNLEAKAAKLKEAADL